MIPVLLTPILAGTAYGALKSFDVPMREVSLSGAILILMTGNSIFLLFYYRFIVMLPEGNWFKRYLSENTRIAIIVFLHVICISVALFVGYTVVPGDQAKLKLKYAGSNPDCINPELFDPYALALSPYDDGESLLPYWIMQDLTMFYFSCIFMLTTVFGYFAYHFISRAANVSQMTKNAQKAVYISMTMQKVEDRQKK
ncbi:hypothetical protein WR25_26984 [Diploscapter pachys]|uniref:Uncharacterized protein n=1 Tax=Diploscapter pachys TaxID=2018661 RepID=A0A2A2KBF0_9BILA|nr:hypothetical protein WR25_26984 [Diploscapter pachys]